MVIVSNNGLNRVTERMERGMVTVVPLTGNTTRVYDFQVVLPAVTTGLPRDSKAQAEQVRSIGVSRLSGAAVGQLPEALMERLNAALRLHLDL